MVYSVIVCGWEWERDYNDVVLLTLDNHPTGPWKHESKRAIILWIVVWVMVELEKHYEESFMSHSGSS